jgi:hypothetical protein
LSYPLKKKICGPSPQANYTDRATATCRQLVPTFVDRGCHVFSVTDPYGRILGFLDRSRYFFFQVAPQLYSSNFQLKYIQKISLYLKEKYCHARQTSIHRRPDVRSGFIKIIAYANNNIPAFNGFLTTYAFLHVFKISSNLIA